MPATIDRDDVRRLTGQGAQLVEVLPRKEYGEAHLPGALSLPLDELTPESASTLDRTRPVIVYCYDYACDLSPRAAWRLETLGFQSVSHYVGGKADWMAAGLPIEGAASGLATTQSVARTDVPTCSLTTPVAEIRRLLQATDWRSCFVVNAERIVLGRVYRSRLGDHEGSAEDVMDPGPVTFRPDITVQEMTDRMRAQDLRTAPITTADGELVGVVVREDLERLTGDQGSTKTATSSSGFRVRSGTTQSSAA